MTVKELRDKLAEFPDDIDVVISVISDGNYLHFFAESSDTDNIYRDKVWINYEQRDVVIISAYEI